MEIKKVTDTAFRPYGKVITGYDCRELLDVMAHTPVPEDVIYVASAPELECLEVVKKMEKNLYGQIPIQAGDCNGHNKKMNAMEYHRSSEINVAVTDVVLMLGKQQDMEPDGTYDTGLAELFLVPAGTVIEVYATTLHYAPCHVDEAEGFRVVVVLPKGTNDAKPSIAPVNEEDKRLWARNKWLLAHAESTEASQGAPVGLSGVNIDIANNI